MATGYVLPTCLQPQNAQNPACAGYLSAVRQSNQVVGNQVIAQYCGPYGNPGACQFYQRQFGFSNAPATQGYGYLSADQINQMNSGVRYGQFMSGPQLQYPYNNYSYYNRANIYTGNRISQSNTIPYYLDPNTIYDSNGRAVGVNN